MQMTESDTVIRKKELTLPLLRLVLKNDTEDLHFVSLKSSLRITNSQN